MGPPSFGSSVACRGATFQFPGRAGSSENVTVQEDAKKTNAAKGKRANERNRKHFGDVFNTESPNNATTTAKRPRMDAASKVTENKKTINAQKKKQPAPAAAAGAGNTKKAAASALRAEQLRQETQRKQEAAAAAAAAAEHARQQARRLQEEAALHAELERQKQEQERDRQNHELLQRHQQQLANKRQREVDAQREAESQMDDTWKSQIHESKRYRQAKHYFDDPQDMVEYRADIIQLMNDNEKEYAPTEYMSRMMDVTAKNRMTLVDWLLEVHFKFKMEPETLYLAISMLDRYLNLNDQIRRSQLQLCGGVCLMIASKFQEVNLPMTVSDVCYIMDGSYNAPSVKEAECLILQALNFKLIVPSPHAFIMIFAQTLKLDFKDHIFFLASFFLDCTLLDVCFLRYTPRQRAAASLFLAFSRTGVFWTPDMLDAIGFPESNLREWAQKIESSYKQHQKFALYKKYERPQTREIVEFYRL